MKLIAVLDQALRFGLVGLVSNIALYALFLIALSLDLDSKIVVTILYLTGLSATYILNRRWSFECRGSMAKSGKRYIVLYGSLYLTNVALIWAFVDHLGVSPAALQACVMLIFIPIAFLMQRYWVFSPQMLD